MRFSRQRHESKYLAVKHFYETKGWSIAWMCKVLEIARSAYYKWLHREKSQYEIESEQLACLIVEYDQRFGHILGYDRMTDWMNRLSNTDYKIKRVHNMMKKLNIHSVIRPKKKKYIYSKPEIVSENILRRNFNACRPNEKWSTDVTEFKIPNSTKKLYLSAILDLYDRSIISYVISKRNNNQLVFDTYKKAIDENPNSKAILHSDRGFQYTSKVFKTMLNEQGIEQSMSRVGCCIDNGPTEGLWGIIKSEMYALYQVIDEQTLIQAINDYIHFYNYERFQKRFNVQAPMEVRLAALNSQNPVQYSIAENKRIEKYKAKFVA